MVKNKHFLFFSLSSSTKTNLLVHRCKVGKRHMWQLSGLFRNVVVLQKSISHTLAAGKFHLYKNCSFFFVGLLKHLFQRPTEDTTERKTRHHKRFISGKTGRYTVNWCNICTCKTLDTKETRASLYLNKYCIYLQVANSVFICWICRLCAIHTKTQLKQTVKAG